MRASASSSSSAGTAALVVEDSELEDGELCKEPTPTPSEVKSSLKSEVRSKLDLHLRTRPNRAQLIDTNILKAFDADPGLQKVINNLVRRRLQRLLAAKMAQRKSIQTLIREGVLKQDPSLDKTKEDMFRRMSNHDLTEFLTHRPSLDELVKANLVEDVMNWTSVHSTGNVPPARNCHECVLVTKSIFDSGTRARTHATSPTLSSTAVGGLMSGSPLLMPRTPDLAAMTASKDADSDTSVPTFHSPGIVEQMYLFGGWTQMPQYYGTSSIDLFVLELRTKQWQRPLVGGLVPCDRYGHTCAQVKNQVVLMFGGYTLCGERRYLNDLHALDLEHKQQFVPSLSAYGSLKAHNLTPMLMWFQPEATGEPPSPRASHACCVCESRLYIFGGNNNVKSFNDMHVLDMDSLKWTRAATSGLPPSARSACTMTAVSHMLYVFGGSNGKKALNDMYAFNTATNTWRRLKTVGSPPSPRAGHSCCCIRANKLLVFGGGFQTKILDDLHLFDTETLTWSRPSHSGALPSPRAGHSMCVSQTNNAVYFFGGGDVEQVLYNDFYVLDTGYFRSQDAEATIMARKRLGHGKHASSKPSKRGSKMDVIPEDEESAVTTSALRLDPALATSAAGVLGIEYESQSADISLAISTIESRMRTMKVAIDTRVAQFQMKEQSYCAILRAIDAERAKMVDDISREQTQLGTFVSIQLAQLQQKFVTRALKKRVQEAISQSALSPKSSTGSLPTEDESKRTEATVDLRHLEDIVFADDDSLLFDGATLPFSPPAHGGNGLTGAVVPGMSDPSLLSAVYGDSTPPLFPATAAHFGGFPFDPASMRAYYPPAAAYDDAAAFGTFPITASQVTWNSDEKPPKKKKRRNRSRGKKRRERSAAAKARSEESKQ